MNKRQFKKSIKKVSKSYYDYDELYFGSIVKNSKSAEVWYKDMLKHVRKYGSPSDCTLDIPKSDKKELLIINDGGKKCE